MFVVAAMSGMDIGNAEAAVPPMVSVSVGVVFIVLMSYSSILHASSVGILYAFHHGLVHSDQPLQPRRVGLHVAGELAPLQPR